MKVFFNKKYILDGLLIVFSVLFALFINNIAETIKKNNKKKIAIENIRKEIIGNLEILENCSVYHVEVRKTINSIIKGENDSLKEKLLSKTHLELGLLTGGKPVLSSIISKTAWETAKTTGIISEFGFLRTKKLTEVYALQDMLMDKTLLKLLDYLYDPHAHDMANIDSTLIQLQLRFRELAGQEDMLIGLCQDALEEM
ncbi:hypothetical protein L3073_03930 [Ancylomarina sp. DW003]|nr:hypothetical protein [Ancylomarina sp. DW003]MDE5421347.1 hypothetical protein [Ancylomarina sp. DW003]